MDPQAGDLLRITVRASIQFVACEPFLFTVIRKHDWSTYQGWVWLDGYQLDDAGVATDRRSIFVQYSGLELVYRRPVGRSNTRHRETAKHYPNTRPAVTARTRPRSYSDVGSART